MVDIDREVLKQRLPEDPTPEETLAVVFELAGERVQEADFALVVAADATDTGQQIEAAEFRSMVIVNPMKRLPPHAQVEGMLVTILAIAMREFGFWGTIRRMLRLWRGGHA